MSIYSIFTAFLFSEFMSFKKKVKFSPTLTTCSKR